MEQCFGPLVVGIVPGKHCDFSTHLSKRARAQSGACAEVKIPDIWNRAVVPWQQKWFQETLEFQLLYLAK
jgi:hypothetical protein